GLPVAVAAGRTECLPEEVVLVPARAFFRVADQLANARVEPRHARGVAVLDRRGAGVVAGAVVAVAQEVAQRHLRVARLSSSADSTPPVRYTAGTPARMKAYWSLRTNTFSSGNGS